MDKSDTQPDRLELDQSTAAELMAHASVKLLHMLKAKRAAKNAASTREFAVRSVRGFEPIIQQLFETGASTQEILAQLIEALPSIPIDDLRYALNALRDHRKRLRIPAKEPAEKKTPRPAKPESSTSISTTTGMTSTATELPSWADGSDQLPSESHEDYRLRKEIEGPPEAKRKFIGEHNA